MKRAASTAAQFIVLLPVMPFYFMSVVGDAARNWGWAHRVVGTAERINDWGHQ